MHYRTLGNSDLDISEIVLGSWLTYGVGVDRDRAKACVDRAFDESRRLGLEAQKPLTDLVDQDNFPRHTGNITSA